MSDLPPPDDSLSQYFDELLGGSDSDSQINLPLAVGDLVSANVVSLAGRSKSNVNEKKSVNLPKPLIAPVIPEQTESRQHKEQDQKQKLEKLLQTAQHQLLKKEPTTEPLVQEQEIVPVSRFVNLPDEIQEWVIDEPQIEVVDIPDVPVVQQPDQVGEEYKAEIANLEWAANGLPQWAQSDFDVLLFDVAGLTLAVPLISLGQIYPLTDELTPLFGQADWFMGLQPTPTGKVRTVNTARFVMPEKYTDACLDKAKYVMSLDGVPWGLALDAVNQPIRLDPDQVKWRSDRSKRPWLAGTVKEHMCALLDVPRIAQLLLDADKNHKAAK